MTGPTDDNDSSDWEGSGIRVTVLALGATQVFVLVYAFYYILKRANPKGDGMELLSATPMLLVFLCLTLPALISGYRRTSLGRAFVFVLIATMLNAMFYLNLIGQFSAKG
jgi:drug/metabolite transporter (DMT)-like permease